MIDQEKIHAQFSSEDSEKRIKALGQLKDSFSLLPDREQAWKDLIKLNTDKNRDVRNDAAFSLGYKVSEVPDKQQAWNDLIILTSSEDSYVRDWASYALGSAFPYVPDKQQAWDDLHKLTSNEDSRVRYQVAFALRSVFSYVLDKQQAWSDLHILTTNKDLDVRYTAFSALVSAFSHMPDKQQAWNDLIRWITDKNWKTRSKAASILDFVFSEVPDKQQVWNDLIKLATDEDISVRSKAASGLGFVFSEVPDKQQMWNDLIKLITDGYCDIKSTAISILFQVFSEVPDKQQAWNDLIKLMIGEDSGVMHEVARALVHVFSNLSDKQQAWNDLIKLTTHKNIHFRASANYSLGKVSIFKASHSENEEEYKRELENAIAFFEKAAQQARYYNLAQFCLPFYSSFHTIVFREQDAKKEANKYLAEAKDAARGSKNKQLLIEVVENLSYALTEIQNMEKLDFEAKKSELNFYIKYCNRAEELMIDAEGKAPSAIKVLRKGLPILDRKLKELLEEIQNKSKIVCKESKGTTTEEIACAVSKEVQKWEIGNQEEMNWYVNNLVVVLKSKIPHSTENKEILDMIEDMKYEKVLTKQYRTLSSVIGLIPTVNVVSEQELDQKLDQKLQKFDLIFNEIIYIKDKLCCISFDIAKIKLNSADVISNLKTMKEELEKLNKIEGLNTLSIEKLNYIQTEKLNSLKYNILECLDEIKILIGELPKNDGTKEILERLNKLKQSDLDILLQRSSGIATLVSFFAMFV